MFDIHKVIQGKGGTIVDHGYVHILHVVRLRLLVLFNRLVRRVQAVNKLGAFGNGGAKGGNAIWTMCTGILAQPCGVTSRIHPDSVTTFVVLDSFGKGLLKYEACLVPPAFDI